MTTETNLQKRTLSDISEDLTAIEELMLEAGGDVTDAQIEKIIDDWLAQLGDERDKKLDGYCALIEEHEANAVARQTSAERLMRLAGADRNLAKRLKKRLKFFFIVHGLKRVDTARFRIWLQANGGKLPVLLTGAVEDLPKDLLRVEVTVEPDKEKIRERLEAGDAIPGAALGERGQSLRIK